MASCKALTQLQALKLLSHSHRFTVLRYKKIPGSKTLPGRKARSSAYFVCKSQGNLIAKVHRPHATNPGGLRLAPDANP